MCPIGTVPIAWLGLSTCVTPPVAAVAAVAAAVSAVMFVVCSTRSRPIVRRA
jgi:hypothetical protein